MWDEVPVTYVVGLAAGGLGQLVRIVELRIKCLALLLCARILPIRAEGMAEGAFPLALGTALQLLHQCLSCIQSAQQGLRTLAPKHSPMLHPGARNALHFGKIGALVLQALQHEINGLKEHGNGRKHLALVGIGEHALLDAILGEVGVEVDLGFVDELEVGSDNDAWKRQMVSST